MRTSAFDRLRAADPVAAGQHATQEWREELLARIAAEPEPTPRKRGRPHARLVLVGVAVLALLALPSYGVARDVIEWVRGEPAPQAVVQEFESYAPQLGYQPDAGGAILVAAEGNGVRLYSTTNDKGSYCLVLRAPGRPSGDGGTCIQPAWAAEPLIAGILGTARGGDPSTQVLFIGGRSDHPGARSISFADPDAEPITRPIGFDGYFVASVRVRGLGCEAGDWRPTFVVRDSGGGEIASAAITLLFSHSSPGVCSSTGPHPSSVR